MRRIPLMLVAVALTPLLAGSASGSESEECLLKSTSLAVLEATSLPRIREACEDDQIVDWLTSLALSQADLTDMPGGATVAVNIQQDPLVGTSEIHVLITFIRDEVADSVAVGALLAEYALEQRYVVSAGLRANPSSAEANLGSTFVFFDPDTGPSFVTSLVAYYPYCDASIGAHGAVDPHWSASQGLKASSAFGAPWGSGSCVVTRALG